MIIASMYRSSCPVRCLSSEKRSGKPSGFLTRVSLSIRLSRGGGVANATVIIAEKTLEMLKNQQEITTDGDGYFRFDGVDMVEFIVKAQKSGCAEMKNRSYHLYFKRQNFHLPVPLVLRRAE